MLGTSVEAEIDTYVGQLALIGYWLGPYSPDWPDVRGFVDPGWDPAERAAVIRYLREGKLFRTYRGYSCCRFCACLNGTTDLTDGTFIWPEGLPHYLDRHRVSLPRYVVDHALVGPNAPQRVPMSAIEDAIVNMVWWKEQQWRPGYTRTVYWSDQLEMLRQEFAFDWSIGRAPSTFRDRLLKELGTPGDYLFEAVIEAQCRHESLYGPVVDNTVLADKSES